MNERMDERYGLDTPQEREREAMDLRAKYQALEKRNERMADLVHYARHYLHDENLIDDEEFAALVTDAGQSVARLEGYDKLRKENADLKAKVERIRHPMVYEGATFYTQAAVPDICPDCDGRNFVSHGVRGMVCWTCCLMRDLEAVQAQVADGDLAFNHANEVVGKLEAQVARLSALVSDEEPDTCEGCEKPLREDEGHETEDMVMLCDECWQGMLDDPDCHSEECQCALCIASRTTPDGASDPNKGPTQATTGALNALSGYPARTDIRPEPKDAPPDRTTPASAKEKQ